ncbi:hypothetical protein [Cohnella massiliensis]|uniref:hypothetical protein n=1 Tax=Cohnella massiliensis TaxID=1816691 RepID=UPI0009BC167E|nr:hypothetical protein [Cohnella massiliensis]
MIVHLRFRECEHNGDLDQYARDVAKSGGTVVYRELDAARERGMLAVELADETQAADFWRRFERTDSYRYCS